MGRFENKFGAHAGFSIRELECLLGRSFATVQNMTDVYYLKLYPKWKKLLMVFRKIGISKYIYPSIYFMGIK